MRFVGSKVTEDSRVSDIHKSNNANCRTIASDLFQVKVSHSLSLTFNPILLAKLSINSNSNIVEHFNFIPSDLSNGDIVIIPVFEEEEEDDVKVG